MNPLFRFLSSLRLTIFLLACSMALVFFATLDQVNWGIWHIQKAYFESWVAAWPLNPDAPVALPLPGGFTLGGLLLVNLVCAHFRHFRLHWSKLGVAIIHTGVVVLILGGFLTAMLQEETQMEIPTGESRNHTTDFRRHELVLIDKTDPTEDRVTAIPDTRITRHGQHLFPIENTGLTLRVRRYWENANIGLVEQNPAATAVEADRGQAARTPLAVFAAPLTHAPDEINRGAALVAIETEDTALGTWLVSASLLELFPPQRFEHQGRTYEIALRLQRTYLPYSLHLEKFTHEYYPGTAVPKNFSSTVRIENPGTGEQRAAVIYMNHPLRYQGLTFYQSQFKSGAGPDITILQVVRNPGRLLPYIAVYLVGLGLLVQFGMSLARHLGGMRKKGGKRDGDIQGAKEDKRTGPQKKGASPTSLSRASILPPSFGVAIVLLLLSATPARADDTADAFARFPVQHGGRLQPADTLARNALLILRGKQSVAFSPAEAIAFGQRPSSWSDTDKARLAEAGIALSPEVLAQLEKRPVPLKTRFGRGSLAPVPWLLELAFRPKVAAHFKVFRIDNDEVLALLGQKPDETAYYSWNEILPALPAVDEKARAAAGKEAALRTPFERGILKLSGAANTYHALAIAFAPGDLPDQVIPIQEYMAWLGALQQAAAEVSQNKSADGAGHFDPRLQETLQALILRYQSMAREGRVGIVPPRTSEEIRHGKWANLGETLLNVTDNQPLDKPPVVPLLADLYAARQAADPVGEASAVAGLKALYGATDGIPATRLTAEVAFNRIEPFYKALCLYVAAFLLVCVGWAANSRRLIRGTAWLVTGIFVLHTLALLARMWIQGRPPVTNLYSSAVFVAWGAVLLGILVERFLKDGIGSAAASSVGFASLIIAHHLAMSGDTLEMMQAVLDSNFWLATHVVTITFGYSAMFVAGLLGALYLVLGVFTRRLRPETGAALSRVVYGVMCFATLLSFVGTMLGGIWADQSWGRFWGWDPKENGALLIVLWCAIFLHARWGRLASDAGLMQMAVFGNIITAASWFGTNLLGVGLHSYGFTESGFFWLSLFWLSQALVLALGWLPRHRWRSGT